MCLKKKNNNFILLLNKLLWHLCRQNKYISRKGCNVLKLEIKKQMSSKLIQQVYKINLIE